MRGGLVAVVCILGVSWMGSSLFAANEATIVGGIAGTVRAHPWVFAVGLSVLSLLLWMAQRSARQRCVLARTRRRPSLRERLPRRWMSQHGCERRWRRGRPRTPTR
jgi:hypothetical protein